MGLGLVVNVFSLCLGMFAVHTDHAANMSRHSDRWMTWEKTAVNLAWLGFADLHSKISHYFINVGSTFMGSDLNEVLISSEFLCLAKSFWIYIWMEFDVLYMYIDTF